MKCREAFLAMVKGWSISHADDLIKRIEMVAEWSKTNSPLLPDEESILRVMIECLVQRGFGDDMVEWLEGPRPKCRRRRRPRTRTAGG